MTQGSRFVTVVGAVSTGGSPGGPGRGRRGLLDGGDLTAPVTEDPTRRYVDLADEAELRRFVLERTAQVPLP